MKKLLTLILAVMTIVGVNSAERRSFNSGEVWLDTNSEMINAHGGGLLFHKGRYYWIGEHKGEKAQAREGIRMYSSKDLYTWRNEGIVMSVAPEGSGSDIESGCIIERPKVVYNKKTKKFVIWFHLELKGKGYAAARYGVAQSDNITGPYEFLYSSRSSKGEWPINMSKEEQAYALTKTDLVRNTPEGRADLIKGGYVARDIEGGQMSRDQTIFIDDDGTAYHIFASEENATLHIAELTDDYLYHIGKWQRVLPGRSNEAPAVMKREGKYWMISSGCTGWAPNKARLAVADSMMGEWRELPNPCRGEGADTTFGGQSTYILKVEGKRDEWIFMADIWRPNDLADSRYIWLPIQFDGDGTPYIEWE
ncbi:MAG: glycoside hydrolase family 43 protein [Rikenellaceae bacterium]